jgi:Trypsin-co-occurring domain 1
VTEFTSFALANDLRVTVETPAGVGVAPAGLHPKVTKAGQTLREALAPVTSAAAEVIEKFRELPGRPAEIEIHFGVKLDAAMGAVIATTTIGTHLDVTLRWTCCSPGAEEDSGRPGETV